ncbi:metallopeptidase family M24-domain-containing protein [Baffinella frigidus]|nr:metallopeptidase family M24-domain-containing protein [Cryptophyta sp. CCMP2293]
MAPASPSAQVLYTDEIPSFVASAAPKAIYVYSGVNSDSKSVGVPAAFDGIETYRVDSGLLHPALFEGRYRVDTGLLHPALFEARVTKSAKELLALRFANQTSSKAHISVTQKVTSSKAHISVMQKVKPSQMEYQMEADFLHYCYFHGGMRHSCYTAICGCGPNAAVLHYGHAGAPNNRTMPKEEMPNNRTTSKEEMVLTDMGCEPNNRTTAKEEMVLNDMGCEYYCYASDITCSFPVSGSFTPAQRGIYEAVLEASIETAKAAGPGKSWVELHKLATRIIASHLIK